MKTKFAILLCVISVFSVSLWLIASPLRNTTETQRTQRLHREDPDLQATAASALGQREGAIVIIDPQTGDTRAVVNPEIALENSAPPGSAIKPFITLAALRAGIISKDTRLRCRQKYKREDVVDSCSHPPNPAPFAPAEALAYSCNYYFASIGERLQEEAVTPLLTELGLGQMLARGRWQPESAVGEGPYLQVTPIQLARAYASLFNGQVHVSDEERAILIEGMRGAVEFGTAEKADLDSLPTFVIGKTGTSTPLQGFRPQGWFVGIAFAPNTKPEPTNAQLVVVVYLKNAHGSDAAEIARPIFEEFAGKPTSKTFVTVNEVRENVTRKVSLEDYVLQVVSTEASLEDESEALKALAIAARTYALKNIGRHREHGYDFCSTTHCQRFESTDSRTSTATAVRETAGLVLRDERDVLADSYYSASCGGMTANIKTIWHAEAQDYLRGVHDTYCNSGPHYRWTDVIRSDRLAAALRSDPRTDVGKTIRELSVSKLDRTGRAELVTLVGDRRRAISGWEFKLIVGRALGWQWLKSSRFTVSRSGSEFVFRGGGFGHGLGLCQEGSHVMAQRGQSFQQILAHYFPGTRVTGVSASRLSGSHFQLSYPRTIDASEAEQVLSFLESSRTQLLHRVSAAGIQARFPNLEVVINETTGDFVGRTGMPPWAAAATKNRSMELQPLPLLKQRRILETTLRHELVHVLIDSMAGGQTPRWFTEGMAVYLAGEGKMIERYQPKEAMSVEVVEQALASIKSPAEMRSAYAAAYKLIKELIRAEGEAKVWQRVAERRYSVKRVVAPALIC